MRTLLIVGVGGFLGANVRYVLATWLTARLGWPFPYGTLFVNVSGSFLLAVFLTWAAQQIGLSSEIRLLVATGFFGAYTTYSTFAVDAVDLMNGGRLWTGLAYILVTNALCLLGVAVGIALVTRLMGGDASLR